VNYPCTVYTMRPPLKNLRMSHGLPVLRRKGMKWHIRAVLVMPPYEGPMSCVLRSPRVALDIHTASRRSATWVVTGLCLQYHHPEAVRLAG
jgi:hypothetical protein